MTDGSDEEIVTFRLAPRDRAAIQRLVDKGEYRNRSDFLRYAVKATLRDSESPPPSTTKLDLDLEQVDLPHDDAPARAAPRRGRDPRSNSR